MAEGTLLDETKCPACACPAATHYRNVLTQAFQCPPGGDPVKLAEMVARAPKVPNAAYLRNQPRLARPGVQQMAAAEIEKLRQANPDLDALTNDITRIGSQNPTMPIRDVIALARQQFRDRIAADRAERAARKERVYARLDAAAEAAGRMMLAPATPVPERFAAEFDADLEGLVVSIKNEGGRTVTVQRSEKPKPAPITRRRFNLEDE